MKFIGSLFILGLLVFVYSRVSPKHFLHVFKNRWCTSLPLLLNPHLLTCSAKVRFLVHCTLFISLHNFEYSPKQLSGTSLHSFVEKGIKPFQLLSKKAAILTLFKTDLFGAAHGQGGRSPTAENLSDISHNNETWHTYVLPKEDPKIYKSHDTHLEFC